MESISFMPARCIITSIFFNEVRIESLVKKVHIPYIKVIAPLRKFFSFFPGGEEDIEICFFFFSNNRPHARQCNLIRRLLKYFS